MESKTKLWDILDGLSYGVKKHQDAKFAKPIAVRAVGDESFVLGFVFNDGSYSRPTKLAMASGSKKLKFSYFKIESREWEEAAKAWIERNKPLSAFMMPDVVDMREKVPLPDGICIALAKQLEDSFSNSKLKCCFVDTVEYFSRSYPTNAFIVDIAAGIEKWIVEKDLDEGNGQAD